MLIAIEGIDGAGKTTQLDLLTNNSILKSTAKSIFRTKQPTNFYRGYDRYQQYVGGEISFDNSRIIYELALLSASDKMLHYETEIMPNKSNIIICDRYVYSAYAYFLARGINDIEWLKSINKFLPLPDIVFYIDIDPNEAVNRVAQRKKGYSLEETNIKMLSNIRNNFLVQPWGKSENYYIIDGGNLRLPEQINQEIIDVMLGYLS